MLSMRSVIHLAMIALPALRVGSTNAGTCEASADGDMPWDCEYEEAPAGETCAAWTGDKAINEDLTPVIIGCIVGALMAFGIGGNDSANCWGTSVGSGALPLRTACLLGGLGEFLGATFLGAGVSNKIQKGVADLDDPDCWACGHCNSNMDLYQFGMFAALLGAALFLLMITTCSMPVSTTHSIVGGVVGMTWTAVGWDCLSWKFSGLTGIVLSWVASPLVSGIIGVIMYLSTKFFVFRREDPVKAALIAVPILFGLTSGIMCYLILAKTPITKSWTKKNMGVALLASLGVMIVVPILVWLFIVPGIKRAMNSESLGKQQHVSACDADPDDGQEIADDSEEEQHEDDEHEDEEKGEDEEYDDIENIKARNAFQSLLVFTAFLESFAHGANDTANATGPLGAILSTYQHGRFACKSDASPWWLMSAAGVFVALGVYTMGYKVIKTMGKEITKLDFHIAFCVEFASSASVVIATFLGFPVSTTHCQVGAVVFVGLVANGGDGVAWGMFGKIALSWVATLPLAGGLSAALVAIRMAVAG